MNNIVVSINTEPDIGAFQSLLDTSLLALKDDAKVKSKEYLNLLGIKLEQKVFDILDYNSKGTVFENSIELFSGQKFPDIVAKKYYGVEVKTTKSNHWKSTGSSIAEGTRVDGVERIFMLFGKMFDPVEFICRPYQDCLSEIVVTHSPRYLIDMKLEKGNTIFDKLAIPYDELRKQENPIQTIKKYYRKKLKKGDDLWWIDQESTKITNMIIRVWNNLDMNERKEYLLKGFCFFPELVSNHPDKFNRFSIWLATGEGVICPNVRDIFTAGGQGTIIVNDIETNKIPQIIMKLHSNIKEIKQLIEITELDVLAEFWKCKVTETTKFEKWIELISLNSKKIFKNGFDVISLLKNN